MGLFWNHRGPNPYPWPKPWSKPVVQTRGQTRNTCKFVLNRTHHATARKHWRTGPGVGKRNEALGNHGAHSGRKALYSIQTNLIPQLLRANFWGCPPGHYGRSARTVRTDSPRGASAQTMVPADGPRCRNNRHLCRTNSFFFFELDLNIYLQVGTQNPLTPKSVRYP